MDETEAPSVALQDLIDWLKADPVDDPVVDLAALKARLPLLAGPALPVDQREAVLEAAAARVSDITGRLRPQLLAAHLPLPLALYETTEQACSALLDVAGAYAELVDLGLRHRPRRGGELAVLGAQGLTLVGEAFALAGLAAANTPFGAWRLAHRLAQASGAAFGEATGAARVAYLRILAVAVSQPDGLTARELAWLFDFLDERILDAATLTSGAPADGGAAWWIDPAADAAPVALSRSPVPDGLQGEGRVWAFNPRTMAQKLSECIDWVTAHMTAAELAGMQCEIEPLAADEGGFPPGLAPLETLALLRRLRMHWMATPVREQPRRQHQYMVQVCVGLKSVWELGCGRREQGRVLEWVVLNESPGGYAIMSVAGVEGEVEAGIAVALRRDPEQPWSVCVVRWVRSENPGQVELGLQLIGSSFQSVRVGFRGATSPHPSPALALPVMEPVRRHPAMLALSGTYASRRFVFVRDLGRVYVAQARALGLDMQTPSIELFQYEIDPYPI